MWCSLLETSDKFLLLHVSHTRAQHFQEQLCICLLHISNASRSGINKFWYEKFQLLSGKIEKAVFVVLIFYFFIIFMNDKIQNFRKLSLFPEHSIDLHDFQGWIQYSHNTRHVSSYLSSYFASLLVSCILSPVNHKGLNQGYNKLRSVSYYSSKQTP